MADTISAAMAAEGAAEIFGYNRENFLEDREMRMKKEFQERKMRCDQANLWREDVRDFVGLTERKMKYYLLVNVLLLGFNVNLWCEGRLPEEVPAWLMMGNQIAIGGSFMFLLLTVWLSMHAAVSAQSYCTRILTQLVRPPIPTWEELESCRTNASDFEKMEAQQMFRIPFLMRQDRVAMRSAASASRTPQQQPSAQASGATAGNPTMPMACDPWGLERRGDDILELGQKYGEDAATLRHIKLIRQASVYWQTYDAFARVSMSIGVNQLMLAMAYFILGYALVQVHAPAAAFAGVIVLVCCAEVIARVDLTLGSSEQRLIQALLVFGPMMSCLAAYHWDQDYEYHLKIAECLAPLAFFSHGLVLALTTLALRVREQENGAMMPLAFKGVLFLDVFGWIHHSKGSMTPGLEGDGALMSLPDAVPCASTLPPVPEDARAEAAAEQENVCLTPRAEAIQARNAGHAPVAKASAQRIKEDIAPWASDYLDGDDSDGSEFSADVGSPVAGDAVRKKGIKPAAATISYDDNNRPLPKRPDDQRPAGVHQDFRDAKGAPKHTEVVDAVAPPAKAFFEAATFMPSEGRSRHKLDEIFDDSDIEGGDNPIVTGHDNESPGLMPYLVFRNAAILLILVWIFAGVLSLLSAAGFGELSIPVWWEEEDEGSTSLLRVASKAKMIGSSMIGGEGHAVVPGPSLTSLVAAGVSGLQLGPASERIRVHWPYPGALPTGLTCDASGHTFLMTDGVAAFLTRMTTDINNATSAASVGTAPQRPAVRGFSGNHVQDRPHVSRSLSFEETVHCPALLGEALLDAALVCPEDAGCEAFVLHRRGRNIASCPVKHASTSRSTGIMPSWLRRSSREKHTRGKEAVSSIFVDPSCRNSTSVLSSGCASISTSHGRVVNLKKHSKGPDMVPANILGDSHDLSNPDPSLDQSGIVRAFNARYLGILQKRRRSIKVLDIHQGGKEVGNIMLPISDAVASFCTGGDSLFLLGEGASPSMWRIPLPGALHWAGLVESIS